jgi:hypothetical protein
MVLVMKVELEGLAAVVERVTVFALSGELKVTVGLVPGIGGAVVLIVLDAHPRLKVGDVQSTGESGGMIAEVLGRLLMREETAGRRLY